MEISTDSKFIVDELIETPSFISKTVSLEYFQFYSIQIDWYDGINPDIQVFVEHSNTNENFIVIPQLSTIIRNDIGSCILEYGKLTTTKYMRLRFVVSNGSVKTDAVFVGKGGTY